MDFISVKDTYLSPQEGVTFVEFALIAALLAIVSITSVQFLGHQVDETFDTSGKAIEGVHDGKKRPPKTPRR
jgi:Flp pilus assembly pilin Flp